jgi:hypothetical protein
MRPGQRVEQIAYVVADVWEAAADHARLFGSGPFYVADRVPAECWYRGSQTSFAPSVALGQCGDAMIELLHDEGTAPSMLHDLFPPASGRVGLHHLCFHVDDFESALAKLEMAGFPTVFRTRLAGGTDVVIADTTAVNGHYLEIHEKSPEIRALYDFIRRAADGFDGSDPVRPMPGCLMPVP